MKKIGGVGVCILLGYLNASSTSVLAAADGPTSGPVILFPGGGLAPLGETSGRDVSVPVGWNIPGSDYQSGDGWWVLSCPDSCALAPSRLSVRKGSHPDYDGPPLPSQLLSWSVPGGRNAGAGQPVPVMLFKPIDPAAPRFFAGPVTTWLHAGLGRYPEGDHPGRMESVIDLGPDGQAVVVPRLVQSRSASDNAAPNRDSGEPDLIFELRAYGKRQRLGSYSWDIEGARPLSGPEYLRWAGDLDRDGKLDLLMSYASRGWMTVLYLSSLAGEGEIVGEAGRFEFSA